MKAKLVIALLVVMALSFLYLRIKQAVAPALPPRTPTVQIGNTTITVEIADTDAKRGLGLSRRLALPQGQGMLFLFDTPARHTFWMNEMKFPLDIIWIREGQIVDISENVPAPVGEESPAVVQPQVPADVVLEVNADFVEEHGIKIGDRVQIGT